MKRLVILCSALMAITVIIFSNTGADDKTVLQKALDVDRLMAIARNEGKVRIIVQLDVPDIEELTAVSTSYKESKIEDQVVQNAMKADAELSAAISSVANSVISRFQNLGVFFNINHTYLTLPLIAMSVSKETLEMLDSAPEVVSITEDRLEPPLLDNTIGIIGADNAWTAGYTGVGWYVAVLDTGIRSSHEFFT